jgi:hypothetical protein
MTENTTQATDASVEDFIAAIGDEKKREDSRMLAGLMQKLSGEAPVLWEGGIVGFGRYRHPEAGKMELESFLIGFSPRKREFAVYVMPGFEKLQGLLGKLGRYKTGTSCLYIKRLSDIRLPILEELLSEAAAVQKNASSP